MAITGVDTYIEHLPVLWSQIIKSTGSWGEAEQRVESAFKAVQGSLWKKKDSTGYYFTYIFYIYTVIIHNLGVSQCKENST